MEIYTKENIGLEYVSINTLERTAEVLSNAISQPNLTDMNFLSIYVLLSDINNAIRIQKHSLQENLNMNVLKDLNINFWNLKTEQIRSEN